MRAVSRVATARAAGGARQGWLWVARALRPASRNNSSTLLCSTGVGRKARTDLREMMASSTADAAPGFWLGVSRIGKIQCFETLRDFTEEQPLDVVIPQQFA